MSNVVSADKRENLGGDKETRQKKARGRKAEPDHRMMQRYRRI